MISKQHTTENKPLLQQRLDVWLWASRFYKTRIMAAAAVTAGHVRVNNVKSKPGKTIKPDDHLTIDQNQQQYCIIILALSLRRLSAPLALSLYDEPDWSREQRQQKYLLFKNNRAGLRYARNKPNKRDRQRMVKVKQQRPELEKL